MLFDSAFNTSFGNQVLCCVAIDCRLLDLCLPACLHSPCCDDECYWCTSCCVKGERELISHSFLFFYFFAYTIMCAFPMYYVSRTTKTPKQQKKNTRGKKNQLVSLVWIGLNCVDVSLSWVWDCQC